MEQLTEDQQAAYNELVDFVLKDSEYEMYCLLGYAGTGKTFTITRVVEAYAEAFPKATIGVTAPVNKAVKVLKKAANFEVKGVKYATVHGLLGLKPKITNTGEQEYVPDPQVSQSIDAVNLLIVDEASMLQDDLFEMLYAKVIENGLKIIFIGDPAQIPPVKTKKHSANNSTPMRTSSYEKYRIKAVYLKEIVRQGKDSPIIDVATYVRNDLMSFQAIPKHFSKALEDSKVDFLSVSKNENELGELLVSLFNSENFQESADYAKIIAWTNKTVDAFNSVVRNIIYGEKAAKIEIGEKLIADKPILNNSSAMMLDILYTTNDEIEIVSFAKKYTTINGKPYAYYDCTTADDKRIPILHEDSEQLYQDTLSELKASAQFHQKRGNGAAYWHAYYNFQNNFADVKYNYAITAHKAQGSTYKNVLVCEYDIRKNQTLFERNRILYTALTRPSHNLTIVTK